MFPGIVLGKNCFQASESSWAVFFVLKILATSEISKIVTVIISKTLTAEKKIAVSP